MKQLFRYSVFFGIFCIFFVPFSGAFAAPIVSNGKVFIDNGVSITRDRKVTLRIDAPANTRYMMISNSSEFDGLGWERYKKRKTWYIDFGAYSHTVFVRFRLKDGTITNAIHDTITLQPAKPSVTIKVPSSNVIDTRYVTVSTVLSNGIESYRYGYTKDLSKEQFVPIKNRKLLSLVVSSGEGSKTIYVDFKDASGQVVQKTVSVTYKPSGRSIPEGSVIVGQDGKYYYYGHDGRMHLFPNEQVLRSWYPASISTISVSNSKIEEYQLGSAVCVRPGTYILKFSGSSQMYLPGVGCQLFPVRSNVEVAVLYGDSWRTRVLELGSTYFLHYSVVREDATDVSADIEDRDKDGVGSDEEARYGTSDKRIDSDSDGLSDFEEIRYWFSDPSRADSDKDGYNDAQEILNGYSPIGQNKLTSIPPDTYTYPAGTVVRPVTNSKKKTMYYVRSGEVMNSLGSKTSSKSFVLNYFQEKFVAEPKLEMSLPKVKGSVSGKEDKSITEPYVYVGDFLKKM